MFGLLVLSDPSDINKQKYEEFKIDPVRFFTDNSLNAEWLRGFIEKTIYWSTCGSKLLRNNTISSMPQLMDSPSTHGPLINYPKAKVERFFGRTHRQNDDYTQMLNKLKVRIMSADFQGIGVAACNSGIVKSITNQYIIDLDRPSDLQGPLEMLHGYKFNFREDKYGAAFSDNCNAHTYLLSSMRFNSELKQCEYKLRNSWGDSFTYPWHYSGTSWLAPTDDNKDLWVPSHLLYRNLTNLSAVVPLDD